MTLFFELDILTLIPLSFHAPLQHMVHFLPPIVQFLKVDEASHFHTRLLIECVTIIDKLVVEAFHYDAFDA